MVYARLTKAEQRALAELASANRRRIADEAGYAVVQHLRRHGLTPDLLPARQPDAATERGEGCAEGPSAGRLGAAGGRP